MRQNQRKLTNLRLQIVWIISGLYKDNSVPAKMIEDALQQSGGVSLNYVIWMVREDTQSTEKTKPN